MSIIVDFSQTMRATIYAEADVMSCSKNPSDQSKNMIKHMILNALRSVYKQFSPKYGKHMILACDNGSWRSDVLPEYKWKRKQKKLEDDSGINWEFVFEVFDELMLDIDKYFPYIVMRLEKCEGDDVIGVLTKYLSENSAGTGEENLFGEVEPEPVLIISSDRDHVQLHTKTVKQYSAIEKQYVTAKGQTPRQFLIEKIVKGDVLDGCPNIRSPNDTFVTGTRQKAISQVYLDTFLNSKNPIECCSCEEDKIRYERNEQLISYAKIPQDVQDRIVDMYLQKKDKPKGKMTLMNYMISNKMNNLLSNIEDFY